MMSIVASAAGVEGMTILMVSNSPPTICLLAFIFLSFLVLSVFFFRHGSAIRGALARVGRSAKENDDEGQEEEADRDMNVVAGTEQLEEEAPLHRFFIYTPNRHRQLVLQPPSSDSSSSDQLQSPTRFLRRLGRSLYGVDPGSPSSILRSQRGVLQQQPEEPTVIVIDADDGQLMRYGRRKRRR